MGLLGCEWIGMLLIKELCSNPYFHALMYMVIFGILGWLFRQKIGKGLCEVKELQVKEDLNEVKEQNGEMQTTLKDHGEILVGIKKDLEWLKKQNGGT